MDKAKDHPNTIGSEFTKEKQVSRPSSVMSNNSSKTNDVIMYLLFIILLVLFGNKRFMHISQSKCSFINQLLWGISFHEIN